MKINNYQLAIRAIFLSTTLCLLTALSARDEITFTSGTTTVGTVIEYRDGDIRAIDEQGRERTVPISAIKSIVFKHDHEKSNRTTAPAVVDYPPETAFARNTQTTYQLDQLLTMENALKQLEPERLITGDRRNLFSWTSTQKTSARYARRQHRPAMKFLGMRVYECIFHYSDDQLTRIDISLYNRGDAGNLEPTEFESLTRHAESMLRQWCNAPARPAAESQTRLANSTVQFTAWHRQPFTVVLEYSSGGRARNFQAEYIKTTIYPYQDARQLLERLSRPPNRARAGHNFGPGNLEKNVVREPNGNTHITGIPMVDQGDKGYCTVATAARVLDYYNLPFDQHALAQVAETETGGGTNLKVMQDQFRNYCARLRVRLRELYDNQAMHNPRDAERFLNRYNRLARRQRKKQLELEDYIRNRVLYVAEMYHDMDIDLLRQTRVENEHRDYSRFVRDIKRYVDQGIPLLWSVRLGLIAEPGIAPQSRGNHTRMIIGYNEESNSVIFSDSWGPGHEKKTMSLDDAWTITGNLLVLLPMP